MTTPTVPKPPPAPRPKQRTMGQSVVGHGVLVGGSVIPWAGTTFGVGGLLAGAGVTAAGVLGAAGARKARRSVGRRAAGSLTRGARSGGSLGGRAGGRAGGTAGGKLLGSRSAGIGGRSAGGKRGGLGSKARGFLGKVAGQRSGTPKRGGGIPGAGTTPTSKRNPLSKGRTTAGRMPGASKRSAGLAGSKTGKRMGSGPKLPGLSRTGRGIPGSRTRAGGKTGTGSRGKTAGTRRGSSTGAGSPKRLGLTKGGKNGKGILGDSRLGKLVRSKPLSPSNLRKRASKALKDRAAEKKKRAEKPTGWEEAPKKTPNTKMQRKEKDMTGAHRPTEANGGTNPARAWRRGSAGGGRAAGNVTAAAEQLASAMAKPGTDINPIKRLDNYLGDMAGGIEATAKGLKDAAAQVAESHPDNGALTEQIASAARLITQAEQALKQAQANNRRQLAADYERIEAPRKNEANRFDYRSNQD